MARTVNTLSDAISYINTLYEIDSDAPTSGEEDYTIWTALLNVAINIWENEEGLLWKELFVKLKDASDGDKTTDGTNSYSCPTNFRYPASGYVWTGSGTSKTPYKVVPVENIQLFENDKGNWCYFVLGSTPTLEFNPNITLGTGSTISYNYYKYADKLTTDTDTFDMSDPMFAVYYVLSVLKEEEGDTTSGAIATQKLEAMKTLNTTTTFNQQSSFLDSNTEDGFGI